jgi:hypothetical protein
MELKEHSLWLSKRDNVHSDDLSIITSMLTCVFFIETQGKDETFLCSLSAFDAYFVTRPYKSPKPFVFAVKSMDNMSFFENAADYLHVFSCGQKEREKWVGYTTFNRTGLFLTFIDCFSRSNRYFWPV